MKKLAGILLAVMVTGLFCSATAVQAQSLN